MHENNTLEIMFLLSYVLGSNWKLLFPINQSSYWFASVTIFSTELKKQICIKYNLVRSQILTCLIFLELFLKNQGFVGKSNPSEKMS